jgi:hypothetical protein
MTATELIAKLQHLDPDQDVGIAVISECSGCTTLYKLTHLVALPNLRPGEKAWLQDHGAGAGEIEL